MTDQEPIIQLPLTIDEALVLYEFLYRFNKTEQTTIFEDQAEQKVFWILEALLERSLTAPFYADYLQMVQRARNRIQD